MNKKFYNQVYISYRELSLLIRPEKDEIYLDDFHLEELLFKVGKKLKFSVTEEEIKKFLPDFKKEDIWKDFYVVCYEKRTLKETKEEYFVVYKICRTIQEAINLLGISENEK